LVWGRELVFQAVIPEGPGQLLLKDRRAVLDLSDQTLVIAELDVGLHQVTFPAAQA
jgi:hypothetical protein